MASGTIKISESGIAVMLTWLRRIVLSRLSISGKAVLSKIQVLMAFLLQKDSIALSDTGRLS